MCKVRNEILEMVNKTLQGIRCPDPVSRPFVEALECLSKGRDITIMERVGEKVAAAIEDQRRIGQHLMLRGIVSRKWQDAIAGYTKERVSSKAGHLVKVIWKQVFKSLWNQHNMFLHTEGSAESTKEHEMLKTTLIRFRQNFRDLLHYMQYNLVEYTDDQIMHWGMDRKREMVNILLAASLSYAAMLRKGDKRQFLITDHWR